MMRAAMVKSLKRSLLNSHRASRSLAGYRCAWCTSAGTPPNESYGANDLWSLNGTMCSAFADRYLCAERPTPNSVQVCRCDEPLPETNATWLIRSTTASLLQRRRVGTVTIFCISLLTTPNSWSRSPTSFLSRSFLTSNSLRYFTIV